MIRHLPPPPKRKESRSSPGVGEEQEQGDGVDNQDEKQPYGSNDHCEPVLDAAGMATQQSPDQLHNSDVVSFLPNARW